MWKFYIPKMIDNYCERIDASFWSEPVNAITNLGFVVAGIIAFILLNQQQGNHAKKPFHLTVLASFMIIIGIGSFLFHTFANTWSLFADIIPIYLFQLIFIWSYQRYRLHFSIKLIAALFFVYFVSIFLSRFIPIDMNGSQMYIPTIIMMLLFSFMTKVRFKQVDYYMLAASLVFTVALTLRTVDEAVCPSFALGTHFGWHLLNAGVVFLSWYSLYKNQYVKKIN